MNDLVETRLRIVFLDAALDKVETRVLDVGKILRLASPQIVYHQDAFDVVPQQQMVYQVGAEKTTPSRHQDLLHGPILPEVCHRTRPSNGLGSIIRQTICKCS